MITEKPAPASRAMTGIFCVILLIIYFFPIYLLINVSLRDFQDLSSRLFFTANPSMVAFGKILVDPQFWNTLKNTVLHAAYEIILLIPIASIGGYGLARSKGLIVDAIRTMNILVMMIPGTALLVGTYSLMVNFGLTNSIFGIALLGVGGGMTGAMFFYTVFAAAIPVDLDEAASIDGAGIIRTFFVIIMPQLKAISITRVIGIVTGCWNSYLMPMFLLTKSEVQTVLLYVRKIYMSGGVVPDIPLAFAGSIIMLLPILIIYFGLQKYIIGGQIDSAMKG